jgi:hypothetical protein
MAVASDGSWLAIGDWDGAPTELSRHAETQLSPSQPQDGLALLMLADFAAKPAASAALRHVIGLDQ